MYLLAQETGFSQLLYYVLGDVYVLAILAYGLMLILLALDFGLSVRQMDTMLSPFLSSLWGRDMTSLARPLYIIIIRLATRRREILMLKLWGLWFLVRLLPS